MNKKGNVIGQIVLWLFIFVVGSLIVSFIIEPSSFDKFKNRVGNIINEIIPEKNIAQNDNSLNNVDYIRLQNKNVYCSDVKYIASETGQTNKQAMERSCKAMYEFDKSEKNIHGDTNELFIKATCENELLTCYFDK